MNKTMTNLFSLFLSLPGRCRCRPSTPAASSEKPGKPVMYTPSGLAYRLFVFSKITSDDGRDVTVAQANGTPVTYRFPAGASVGVPTDRESGFVNRLQRLGADGAPATNASAAVWYDHWYSDGSRVRLSVSNRVSAAVFTAAGRVVTPGNCGVSYALDADGGLRQVWSDADGLADVAAVSGNAVYEIRLYAPDAASSSTNAAGLHAVLGSPHTVWRVSNPDAASGGRTRLLAVENKGAFALTNEWRYIQAKDDWSLTESGGGRTTLKTTEWNPARTEKLQREYVYGPDGKTLAACRASRWETFTWGLAETESVTDPGGLALAVSKTYYTDPSQVGRYAHVKTVLRPDGGWTACDYDAQGRMTLRVTPWLGRPASPSGKTAAELAASGLAVSFSYAPVAAGDTPGLVDDRPRTAETRVAGTLAARSYAAYVREADGSLTEIRETCADLSAAFGAASNVRTATARYPADADARVKSVLSPGGALRTCVYAAGDWTGALAAGDANAFSENASGKALRTTVTEGTAASPDGIPGRSLRTVTYADGRGDAVLAETWARSETGFARVAWTAAAYDAFHNPTSRTDSAGYASAASWTGRDLPVASSDDFGLSYAYAYDALGRLASSQLLTPNSSLLTTYSYDAFDQLSEVSVSGDGLTRQLFAASRDRAARPVSVTDADGRTTAYAYADGGRTVTETLPGGGTLVRAFWPGGPARSVAGTAAAPPVWYTYGTGNGLLWTRAAAGAEDSPAYAVRYDDPAGRAVRLAYADGLSESLAYDLAGRLTNSLDRAGRATRLAWDAFGSPLSVSRQADSGFASVSFGLDLPSLAESVTNEAGVLVGRTVRDIPGRTVTETGIDGLDRVTRYAGGGRAVSVLRPDGVLVTNIWDAAGRLSEVRHGGTPVLGLAWRADGLPAAASNGSARVSWSYDAWGHATNETSICPLSNFVSRISRAYDASALATNTAFSAGRWSCEAPRTYDPAGREASVPVVSGPSCSIRYDATNGLPALVTNAAVTRLAAYDTLGRATDIVYRPGTGTASRVFSYAYAPAGLVTRRVSGYGSYRTDTACRYDALGRITNEVTVARSNPAVTNSYAYDAAGNRTCASTGRWSCAYGYADNRLVSVSTNGATATPVLYDDSGNVTSYVARSGVRMSLAWNSLGQLVSAATNGVLAESYAYDPLGRRVKTTSGGISVFHVYDGDRCVADLDASGRPLCAYSWGPGTDTLHALTVYPPGAGATNVYYAACDAQGSVGFLSTTGGTTLECCEYDAWGCTAISGMGYSGRRSASRYGNRFMFHGGAYSAATGLYQFRARWYAPELGRWLSPDPIGLEGGLNLYEFCRNNPVNCRDPSGLVVAVWGGDLAFVFGMGVDVSGGRAWSFDDSGCLTEEGWTVSAGSDVGWDTSASIMSISIFRGTSVKDLEGYYRGLTVGVWWLSGSLYFNASSGSFLGWTFGVGPSATLFTAHVTFEGKTWAWKTHP